MTNDELNKAFQPWLKYKPARAKEWPGNLSHIYFEALQDYRYQELAGALDLLIKTQAEFPSIAKIRQTIAQADTNHSPINREAEALVLIAGQLIDHHMGLPFAKPDGYASWLDEVVSDALDSARKEVRRLAAENYIPTGMERTYIIRYATGSANRHIKQRLG